MVDMADVVDVVDMVDMVNMADVVDVVDMVDAYMADVADVVDVVDGYGYGGYCGLEEAALFCCARRLERSADFNFSLQMTFIFCFEHCFCIQSYIVFTFFSPSYDWIASVAILKARFR